MEKEDHCFLWGWLSGMGIVAASVTLVVATGGAALIAGGIGLGAAISGEVNAIQQAVNDKKEFDGKSFITNVAIGGAASIVSAGAGSFASSIASKCALEGGKKIATQVGLQAVGGAFSSSAGSCIQTKVNGGEITPKQIIQSALSGMVSAGLGSSVGGATNTIISNNVSAKLGKVLVGVAGGAVGGGAGSIGQQVVSNLYQGRDWDEDCAKAAFNGLMIGGITGGVSAGRDIKLRSEQQPKLRIEILQHKKELMGIEKDTGPFQEMVYKYFDEISKETYYIKEYKVSEHLSQMEINQKLRNYQQAAQQGTGPAVQIVGNQVIVKGHTMLLDAIKLNMITKAEAIVQIDDLSRQNILAGRQHCDFKPSNLIFNQKIKRVQLIDNGDMALFGETRQVGTLLEPSNNQNTTSEWQRRYIVDKTTDKRGIEMTKQRINQATTGKSAVSHVGKHEALRFRPSNVRALKKKNDEEDE